MVTETQINKSGSKFDSVVIDANGNLFLGDTTANNTGKVYIRNNSSGVFTELPVTGLTSFKKFGKDISCALDGSKVAAISDDTLVIFKQVVSNTYIVEFKKQITGIVGALTSVTMSGDGTVVCIGLASSKKVSMYKYFDDDGWTFVKDLESPFPVSSSNFGRSTALDYIGATLVVGEPDGEGGGQVPPEVVTEGDGTDIVIGVDGDGSGYVSNCLGGSQIGSISNPSVTNYQGQVRTILKAHLGNDGKYSYALLQDGQGEATQPWFDHITLAGYGDLYPSDATYTGNLTSDCGPYDLWVWDIGTTPNDLGWIEGQTIPQYSIPSYNCIALYKPYTITGVYDAGGRSDYNYYTSPTLELEKGKYVHFYRPSGKMMTNIVTENNDVYTHEYTYGDTATREGYSHIYSVYLPDLGKMILYGNNDLEPTVPEAARGNVQFYDPVTNTYEGTRHAIGLPSYHGVSKYSIENVSDGIWEMPNGNIGVLYHLNTGSRNTYFNELDRNTLNIVSPTPKHLDIGTSFYWSSAVQLPDDLGSLVVFYMTSSTNYDYFGDGSFMTREAKLGHVDINGNLLGVTDLLFLTNFSFRVIKLQNGSYKFVCSIDPRVNTQTDPKYPKNKYSDVMCLMDITLGAGLSIDLSSTIALDYGTGIWNVRRSFDEGNRFTYRHEPNNTNYFFVHFGGNSSKGFSFYLDENNFRVRLNIFTENTTILNGDGTSTGVNVYGQDASLAHGAWELDEKRVAILSYRNNWNACATTMHIQDLDINNILCQYFPLFYNSLNYVEEHDNEAVMGFGGLNDRLLFDRGDYTGGTRFTLTNDIIGEGKPCLSYDMGYNTNSNYNLAVIDWWDCNTIDTSVVGNPSPANRGAAPIEEWGGAITLVAGGIECTGRVRSVSLTTASTVKTVVINTVITNMPDGYELFNNNYYYNSSNGSSRGMKLVCYSDGSADFSSTWKAYANGETPPTTTLPAGTIPVGVPVCISVVMDHRNSTAGVVKLYVDSNLVATHSSSIQIMEYSEVMYFGSGTTGSQILQKIRVFNDLIDDQIPDIVSNFEAGIQRGEKITRIYQSINRYLLKDYDKLSICVHFSPSVLNLVQTVLEESGGSWYPFCLYRVFIDSDGGLKVSINRRGNTIITLASLNAGELYQLFVVMDGDTFNFYVNGSFAGSYTYNAADYWIDVYNSITTKPYVANSYDQREPIIGGLGHVAVYNSIILPEDISYIWQQVKSVNRCSSFVVPGGDTSETISLPPSTNEGPYADMFPRYTMDFVVPDISKDYVVYSQLKSYTDPITLSVSELKFELRVVGGSLVSFGNTYYTGISDNDRITISSGGNTATLYINGVKTATIPAPFKDTSGGATTNPKVASKVNGYAWSGEVPPTGLVTGYRYYSYTMSDSEVGQL